MSEQEEMAIICPVPHAYSEQSARNKLARHRNRGDLDQRMYHCPWADHWHVLSLAEWNEMILTPPPDGDDR